MKEVVLQNIVSIRFFLLLDELHINIEINFCWYRPNVWKRDLKLVLIVNVNPQQSYFVTHSLYPHSRATRFWNFIRIRWIPNEISNITWNRMWPYEIELHNTLKTICDYVLNPQEHIRDTLKSINNYTWEKGVLCFHTSFSSTWLLYFPCKSNLIKQRKHCYECLFYSWGFVILIINIQINIWI